MKGPLFPARFRPFCAFGIACVALLNSGIGAIIEYRAIGSITSSDYPNEVVVGDQFSIEFAYDDAVRDTNTRTTFGSYPSALHSFSFHLIPELSSGNYAGGFASDGTVETSDYIEDIFDLRVRDAQFAPLGGQPFLLLLFSLADPTQTSSISDPGGAPTLGEVLGGQLDLAEFGETLFDFVTVHNKTGVEGNITSVTVLPEPSILALLALGSVVMARTGRRENGIVGSCRSKRSAC